MFKEFFYNELPRRKRTGYLFSFFYIFAASGGEFNPKRLKRMVKISVRFCKTIGIL